MRDFWEWNSDWIVSLLVFVIFALLVVFGITKWDQAACAAKTESMGFEHRWSFVGGCQIEVNPNQWIPLESYYFKQE